MDAYQLWLDRKNEELRRQQGERRRLEEEEGRRREEAALEQRSAATATYKEWMQRKWKQQQKVRAVTNAMGSGTLAVCRPAYAR